MSEAAATIQLIPFRMLIDEAARMARLHFRSIYFSVAIPVAVLQVLLIVIQSLWFEELSGMGSAIPDPAIFFGRMTGFGCLIFVISLLVWLAYGVMGLSAVDAAAGRSPDLKARWQFVLRPKVLGTFFLVGLSLLGSFLLCCVPAIYVLLLFSLVVPVLAEENLFGGAALARSGSLVGYNPLLDFPKNPMVKIFVILVVGAAVSYTTAILIQLPATAVEQFFFFRQAAQGQVPSFSGWWLALRAPTAVLSSAVTSVVQLYLAFAVALFYIDLRRRREGTDLEAAIDQMMHQTITSEPVDDSGEGDGPSAPERRPR